MHVHQTWHTGHSIERDAFNTFGFIRSRPNADNFIPTYRDMLIPQQLARGHIN